MQSANSCEYWEFCAMSTCISPKTKCEYNKVWRKNRQALFLINIRGGDNGNVLDIHCLLC